MRNGKWKLREMVLEIYEMGKGIGSSDMVEFRMGKLFTGLGLGV